MKVELRRLSKRFGKIHALRDVDLVLPPGRRAALIGPNGSGKSTLIRAILGLIGCDGEILIDGLPAVEARERSAARIASVPQIAPGIRAPVSEMVRMIAATRNADPRRIAAVSAQLGLDFDAVRNRPFRDLSGGMKQKLLIAMALGAEPTLLILDEPTASLDAASRRAFFAVIATLPEETTLLLCSHRLDEMQHMVDHVICMEEGRLAWSGPASDFVDGHGWSIIEVCVDDAASGEWLRTHSFRQRTGGWWWRVVQARDKLDVVMAVTARVGPHSRNLLVRDMESVDADGTGPAEDDTERAHA